jgi:tetratricopeptide (TPR) repeat protein
MKENNLKTISTFVLLTVVVIIQVSCATMPGNLSFFKSEALHNINPAPKNIAPPSNYGKGMIDPVYIQTQADYHFTLAEAYSLDGQSAKAIEEYKLTLLYDETATTVRIRLINEYVKVGLQSEAMVLSEKLVNSNPENTDVRLILASLYSSLKMYSKALDQYNEVLRIQPDHDEVPLFIGAIYAELRDYKKAIGYFQKVALDESHKTNAFRYHYYIARIYLEQGEEFYKKAEEFYLKSITREPKFENSVVGLAVLYMRQLKEDKAEKLLSSYQDRFGPSKKVAKHLSQLYLSNEEYQKALTQLEIIEDHESYNLNVKVRIALILIETKQYKNAITKLQRILLQAPESDKIRFYLGAIHEELEHSDKAIENYKEITPESTYYPEAVIHISYIYKKKGEFENAAKTMAEALKQRDDVAQFYSFYASLLDETKQFNKAVKMLNKALNKFPKNTQIHFFLGSMYDRLGEPDKTIVHMNKVLELDENHIQAMNYLAYTYAEKGEKLNLATELAQKALSLKENDGFILDTLGWVMFKRGNLDLAIKYLEAAYKEVSTESIIAEHLGDVYFNYQLSEKAKAMYIEAARVEKDVNKRKKIYEKITSVQKQLDTTNKLRKPASLAKPSK